MTSESKLAETAFTPNKTELLALADQIQKRISQFEVSGVRRTAVTYEEALVVITALRRLAAAEPGEPVAELSQAHDDLDVFDVPRHEHGRTLSIPGRICLLARREKLNRSRLNEAIDELSYYDLRASGGISPQPAPAFCEGVEAQHAVERVILRRLYQNRIEGYTIETAKEIVDALTQLRATDAPKVDQNAEKMRDETGWLIETDDPPVYVWLDKDHDDIWTPDASKATRFARREDAEMYMRHIGWTSPPVRVVEHMWPALTAARGADGTSSSDGPRKREETATALEAGSSPIRSACIGPLPCGESPASLLPSEANKSGEA